MEDKKLQKDLITIIPVSLDDDEKTADDIVAEVLFQHEQYSFTDFVFEALSPGWRSVGYPESEVYRKVGNRFAAVKDALSPYGIRCGWCVTLTVKSGASDDFTRIVKFDGSKAPFASCPADPAFRKRFSHDIALFAETAKPAFIIFEDDYSINAASGGFGCFCDLHLDEFRKITGKPYTRKEILEAFQRKTPEDLCLIRQWRELSKASMVRFSEDIRTAVDAESPEIPMGYMQSGASDLDGDTTEAIARALSGPRHTPFARMHGTMYMGGDQKLVPGTLFNALYRKEHISGEFTFLHESDTFPHTRFFLQPSTMKCLMSAVYSFGYDGSTFQTEQILDDPGEESGFARMFCSERPRFSAVHRIASQCELKGVGLVYDPFYNSLDADGSYSPYWCTPLGNLGIPFTTKDSSVLFLDKRQTRYMTDDELTACFSKGVILDGEAAKIAVERGFGRYLGVSVGEDVAKGTFGYDLGAREVILDAFTGYTKGRRMPIAHIYAPGSSARLLRLTVTDDRCEVVTEARDFRENPVCPAMTRFENELGGRIVVMGMTIHNNRSQSLFNYRRMALLREMIKWCGGDFAFAVDAPCLFTIMNEAKDPSSSGFFGMLSLINLSADSDSSVTVELPERFLGRSCRYLAKGGLWEPADVTFDGCRATFRHVIEASGSLYVLFDNK